MSNLTVYDFYNSVFLIDVLTLLLTRTEHGKTYEDSKRKIYSVGHRIWDVVDSTKYRMKFLISSAPVDRKTGAYYTYFVETKH